MNARAVEVVSRADGHAARADLVSCDCDCESFVVYLIDGVTHLQCEACGSTFCQHGPACACGLPRPEYDI